MTNWLKNYLFDNGGVFMVAGFMLYLYLIYGDVDRELFAVRYAPMSFLLIMFLSVYVSRLEKRIRELERRELEQTIDGIRKS